MATTLTPRALVPRAHQLVLGGGDLPEVDGFHPAVGTWFRRRFPEGPTAPQREAWPHIAAGADTLVAAPTGSGKTLAGFLVSINRLYLADAAGEPIEGLARVVYVSPLKALAVDIAENLERPLREIAADRRRARPRRARHPGRRPHRRHHELRAVADDAQAAELLRDHTGVALPPRHERERAARAADRRDGDRRRDPRGRP